MEKLDSLMEELKHPRSSVNLLYTIELEGRGEGGREGEREGGRERGREGGMGSRIRCEIWDRSQENEWRCVEVGNGELGVVTKSLRCQESKQLPVPNRDAIG